MRCQLHCICQDGDFKVEISGERYELKKRLETGKGNILNGIHKR